MVPTTRVLYPGRLMKLLAMPLYLPRLHFRHSFFTRMSCRASHPSEVTAPNVVCLNSFFRVTTFSTYPVALKVFTSSNPVCVFLVLFLLGDSLPIYSTL